jgi:hypothetical protein
MPSLLDQVQSCSDFLPAAVRTALQFIEDQRILPDSAVTTCYALVPLVLISVPQVEAFVERITGACVGPNRQVRPFLPCLLLLCITARLSCHSDTVTQCGAMSFSPCQCLHHLSHAGGTNDTRGNGTHAKLLGREA